jgi:hypothetical protein
MPPENRGFFGAPLPERSTRRAGGSRSTLVDSDARDGGLLAWQWAGYRDFHQDRANLILHVVSQPLFVGGTLALLSLPLSGIYVGLAGLAAMIVAVAVQGRGHRRETNPPLPFRGPLDVVARLFAEQFVTFPRFVLSGGLARAWRASAAKRAT